MHSPAVAAHRSSYSTTTASRVTVGRNHGTLAFVSVPTDSARSSVALGIPCSCTRPAGVWTSSSMFGAYLCATPATSAAPMRRTIHSAVPPAIAPLLRLQPVEPEEVVLDRQDLDRLEAGFVGVSLQGVGAHHGSGAGRRLLGHPRPQTAHHTRA